jgi:hypothetical protein
MVSGFEYMVLWIGLGVCLLWAVAAAIVNLFRNR